MRAWAIKQPNGKFSRQIWFHDPRQRDPVQVGSVVMTIKEMKLLGYKVVRVQISEA